MFALIWPSWWPGHPRSGEPSVTMPATASGLAIAPDFAGTIWAATGERVYRSHDGGHSWRAGAGPRRRPGSRSSRPRRGRRRPRRRTGGFGAASLRSPAAGAAPLVAVASPYYRTNRLYAARRAGRPVGLGAERGPVGARCAPPASRPGPWRSRRSATTSTSPTRSTSRAAPPACGARPTSAPRSSASRALAAGDRGGDDDRRPAPCCWSPRRAASSSRATAAARSSRVSSVARRAAIAFDLRNWRLAYAATSAGTLLRSDDGGRHVDSDATRCRGPPARATRARGRVASAPGRRRRAGCRRACTTPSPSRQLVAEGEARAADRGAVALDRELVVEPQRAQVGRAPRRPPCPSRPSARRRSCGRARAGTRCGRPRTRPGRRRCWRRPWRRSRRSAPAADDVRRARRRSPPPGYWKTVRGRWYIEVMDDRKSIIDRVMGATDETVTRVQQECPEPRGVRHQGACRGHAPARPAGGRVAAASGHARGRRPPAGVARPDRGSGERSGQAPARGEGRPAARDRARSRRRRAPRPSSPARAAGAPPGRPRTSPA